MEELELKYLAPYSPYGLRFMLTCDWSEDFDLDETNIDENNLKEGSIWELSALNMKKDLMISVGGGDFESFILSNNNSWISIGQGCKPILRPLSDFWKMKLGEVMLELKCTNSQVQEIWQLYSGDIKLKDVCVGTYEIMNKNHIDYNHLITKGLAIDKNSL